MGLAVLPERLKEELELLKQFILENKDLRSDERIEKHADWAETFLKKYTITKENITEIIEKEVGFVFEQVLCHAGVFKRDTQGNQFFDRFIETL